MVQFQIFNAYTNPATPIAGSSITLTTEIFNTGSGGYTGHVNLIVKNITDNTEIIGICYNPDANTSCDELGIMQMWVQNASFIMPSHSINVELTTYHWDFGTSLWILEDTKNLSLTPDITNCTSATISRDKVSVAVGEIVTFTLWRLPIASGITGNLMKQVGLLYNSIGTCITNSNGYCSIQWTPSSSDIGNQKFRAEFPGCYSTDTYVTVGSAGDIVVTSISVIPTLPNTGDTITITANLINNGDLSTSEFVYLKSDGINIDSNYKTLAAKTTGSVQWTKIAGTDTGFSAGTHSICSETNNNENICTSIIISSVSTTGSINCTTTPSGAQIWLDGINTTQVTPYTLTNISAQMHNVTYKLAGYNDCGVNITVTAGNTVPADCTLVLLSNIVHKELVTNLTDNETIIKTSIFLGNSICNEYTYIGKYQEGSNWVFQFDLKKTCNYVEFGAGAGLARFIGANWSSIAWLLATGGIVSIVWMWRDVSTKAIEMEGKLSDDTTRRMNLIINDTQLTPEQKAKLISEILAVYGNSNCWISLPGGGCLLSAKTGKVILIGVGLYLGIVYVLPLFSSKNNNKEK